MRVLIIGAGKIGCGYLAPLFRSAGWDVVVAARTPESARRICREGRYQIRITSAPGPRGEPAARAVDRTITDITSVPIGHPGFDHAVATADLICTCVGVGNIAAIAPPLAMALARRSAPGPLDVWVVENDDCAGVLQRASESALQGTGLRLPTVGFAGAVASVAVGRGSWSGAGHPVFIGDDQRTLSIDAQRTTMALPALEGVRATRSYRATLREKLFVFNTGHAIFAYLGWLRGHETVPQAVADPLLRPMVIGCMLESRRALLSTHPELGDEVEEPVASALRRFSDAELADPIARVGRDPIRKLSPTDRLLGPVELIRSTRGAVSAYFALSIAGTMLYREPGDAQAAEIGRLVAEQGVSSVLEAVCGLARADPMNAAVAERYRAFIIDLDEVVFPPAHGRDRVGSRWREAM